MDNISFWLDHCHCNSPYPLLEQYGYQHDWIKHGDLGSLQIRRSGKFFELDEDGELMIAQAIWRDIPSCQNPVEEPILYDIIVWHPEHPRQWFFLRGETGLILGEKAMFSATLFHESLRLHSTPFAWLKSGCQGCVLLDCHGLNRLYGLSEVICENVEHGTRVEQGLSRYYLQNIPRLRVPKNLEYRI